MTKSDLQNTQTDESPRQGSSYDPWELKFQEHFEPPRLDQKPQAASPGPSAWAERHLIIQR
jgi:hypothetical protein